MAIRSEKRTIDGIEFTITTLTGVESVKCFQYLVKLVGPALGTLAGSVASSSLGNIKGVLLGGKPAAGLLEQEIPAGALAVAAKELVGRLGDDTVDWLFRFLKGTFNQNLKCVGEVDVFNAVFAGDLPLLMKVVLATLEVNYGSFFGASGVIGKLWTASDTLISRAEAEAAPDGRTASTLD